MSDKCSGCKSKSACTKEGKCTELNAHSRISKVIAVMSGKGGVGKSTVTSLLAAALAEQGYRVGILDADITGPSIPKLFGVEGMNCVSTPEGIEPVQSSTGIKIISLNLLLKGEDEPVIWRGPVIAATVKQFWTHVHWGELDYLLLDLPPGTGDVPLTVMQSLPLNGLVMVSSPQSLVSMIVRKGIRMAKRMNVPILGLIENMSFVRCPDCGKVIKLFGESELTQVCETNNILLLGHLPLDLEFVSLSDKGQIENGFKYIPVINDQVLKITEQLIQNA